MDARWRVGGEGASPPARLVPLQDMVTYFLNLSSGERAGGATLGARSTG